MATRYTARMVLNPLIKNGEICGASVYALLMLGRYKVTDKQAMMIASFLGDKCRVSGGGIIPKGAR